MWTTSYVGSNNGYQHFIELKGHLGSAASFVQNQRLPYKLVDSRTCGVLPFAVWDRMFPPPKCRPPWGLRWPGCCRSRCRLTWTKARSRPRRWTSSARRARGRGSSRGSRCAGASTCPEKKWPKFYAGSNTHFQLNLWSVKMHPWWTTIIIGDLWNTELDAVYLYHLNAQITKSEVLKLGVPS